MAKGAWICTVQLLIPEIAEGEPDITSEAEACDAVSAMLSENLRQSGALLDWSYLKVGGQFLSPVSITVSDEYTEGEAFS